MAEGVYHYDPERIEALCGAYRGAGPLHAAVLHLARNPQRRHGPHLAAPLALCRTLLPDPAARRLDDLGDRL